MPVLDPYLIFNGNCAEAMAFYAQTLGGDIVMTLRYGESPLAEQCAAGSAERIMHTQLRLGDRRLMASDCPPDQAYAGMQCVSLSLSFDTVAEAENIYAALSENAEVRMALAPTFWAGAFAMLVDRFGTPWMINGAPATL